MFGRLTFALFVLTLVSPLLLAQEDTGKGDWSFYWKQAAVPLDRDGRLAVLLDPSVESELEHLRAIVSDLPVGVEVDEKDRQSYENLWFLRVESDAPRATVVAALEALQQSVGVQFASVVLRYDEALMVPRPELILTLENDPQAASLPGLLQSYGLTVIRELPALAPTFHVSADAAPWEVLALSRRIQRETGIHAEPNFIQKLPRHASPNDPIYPSQWHLNNTGQHGGPPTADLNAPPAWDVSTGSPTIVIAIIDEGVDMDHEDLVTQIVGGHDSTNQPSPEGVPGNAAQGDGHGTACAGIAAAAGNNGIGVSGVNWNASILSVRVGYGSHWTETAWIVDALTWAADNGADVLSNSWGGGAPSASIQNAVAYARNTGRGGLGSAVLFSSGNGNTGVAYPAAYPESIAVGSTSPCDERKSPSSCDGETWWGSNFGSELDIVVPGVLIQTTDIMGSGGYTTGNYITNFNGTSSACPNAAGAAALLLSVLPNLTADDVQTYLQDSGDDLVGIPSEDTPGWDPYMGWGRVNLQTLLSFAGAPSPPTNLLCTESAGDVDLSWTNGESYDSVIVSRNGTDIATLGGTATSYSDLNPGPGSYNYGVRGVVAGVPSLSDTCTIFLTGGATDLVWSPVDAGGTVDGGGALVSSLNANGRAALLVTDLGSVGDLNAFDAIWVNLGIYPDNHVLLQSEADPLVSYINDGVGGSSLYMEGGDTWAFDPGTSLHGFFNVSGDSDGTGDLATAFGTGSAPCDLSGIDLSYSGENAWIDHLSPLSGAFTIQTNSSPFYNLTIFNDGTSYRTIGSSHEFGGYANGADTRDDLMAAYLTCFGSGAVPPVTGLSCSYLGSQTSLGWNNPVGYDSIAITRDGSVIATLGGGATSYNDVSPPPGAHVYGVTPTVGGESAVEQTCDVDVPPAAVTSLSCVQQQDDAALSWVNGDLYDSVVVERDGVIIATLPGTGTSLLDNNLAAGFYSYDVYGVVDGIPSAPASCSVTIVAPPGVTGLTCGLSGSDVDLSWSNSASYTSIEIFRDGGLIATLGGAATSYTDTNVSPGPHDYDVVGIVGVLESPASSCSVDAPVPPVSGLACAQGVGDVDLSWTNNATYTQIEIRRDGVLLATLGGGSTSYSDPSPLAGLHTYDVTAWIGGASSPAVSCQVNVVAPPPVTNLSCIQSGSSAVLSWTLGGTYTGIEVRRDGATIATLGGGATGYTDANPPLGNHTYEVIGLDGGIPAPAASCSLDLVLPAVLALNCNQSGGAVLLSWINGATYTSVEVRRNGALIATLAGSATSYTDDPVPAGLQQYTVTGVQGGVSAAPVPCDVDVQLPDPVTNLVCSATGSDAQLSWTNGAAYDAIEVRRDGALIAVIAGSSTGYLDPSPGIGSFLYDVRGVTGALVAPAATCSVDLSPPPVTGLACVLFGASADLSWTNGGSYDAVEIRRNGALLATLAGTATSFSDYPAPEGSQSYEVIGVLGGAPAPAASCVLDINLPVNLLTAGDAVAAPGETGVITFVQASHGTDLEAFAFGLDFDETRLDITEVSLDGTVPGSLGAEFFLPFLDNSAGWYTVQVIMDITTPHTLILPSGVDQDVTRATYDVEASAPVGPSPLVLPETIGSPAVTAEFTEVGGGPYSPQRFDGVLDIVESGLFVRGDAGGDGAVDVSDAIVLLDYVFNSGFLGCLDAGDTNDSGVIDIADAIYLLNYLFQSGPQPPPPFPNAGTDPTPDGLDCVNP